MFKIKALPVGVLVLLLLTACAAELDTGPVEVEWEQDACNRCNMVLSDGHYAAQVRTLLPGEESKVYLFDDIGCALVWLDDKPWKEDPATEIWVNDYQTGAWIDARKAYYVSGHQTPMLYGLGAQGQATPDSVGFERARSHILEVEKRLRPHAAH
jgi:nitrous oxide reductase accessory protein NosL